MLELILAFAVGYPGTTIALPVPDDVVEVRSEHGQALIVAGHALVPIDLAAELGSHSMAIRTEGRGSYKVHYAVEDLDYPENHLTIQNKRLVNPYAEDMDRIRRESSIMRTVFASHTAPVDLSSGFEPPTEGIISSPFGLRRVLNGQPRNRHTGLDIAANTGTPILTTAPGRVAASGAYFFNGNTVLVDHGSGLVSMYCHMDEIVVEECSVLEAGEFIGTVGATGRVTGPHLHWTVSLNNVRIDPQQFSSLLNDLFGVESGADGGGTDAR